MSKHSSLLFWSVGEEDKKLYDIDTRNSSDSFVFEDGRNEDRLDLFLHQFRHSLVEKKIDNPQTSNVNLGILMLTVYICG
jgi:hypothetical protein